VEASYESHLKIAATLVWLSSAIRYTPDNLSVSGSTLSLIGPETTPNSWRFSIKPDALTKLPESRSCWHVLFKHTVIADGFLTPDRKSGIGLEICFQDMVGLARTSSLITLDNGYLLDGFGALLIPVKYLPEDGAVQWHLVTKWDGVGLDVDYGGVSSVLDIMQRNEYREWHKSQDFKTLGTSRAFLGWVENADVIIGTKDMAMTADVSGASDLNPKFYVRTYGISGGLALHGFGLTGTMSSTPSSIASGMVDMENTQVHHLLENSTKRNMIFWDDDLETGWYLPELRAILYIAQYDIRTRRAYLENFPDDLWASSSIDEDKIVKAILGNWDWPLPPSKVAAEVTKDDIWKSEIPKEESMSTCKSIETFGDVIKEIFRGIINVTSELLKVRQDAVRGDRMAPKYIIGIELLHFVHKEIFIPFREAEVNQPWAHLSDGEPFVLFCKNLGAPIGPSLALTDICERWERVPPEQHYLVATSHSIEVQLLNHVRKGVPRLADNITWKFTNPLFHSHEIGENSKCDHLQILDTEKPGDDQRPLLEAVRAHPSAAFIFGNRSHLTKDPPPVAAKNYEVNTRKQVVCLKRSIIE
jgi:hypothetical protein